MSLSSFFVLYFAITFASSTARLYRNGFKNQMPLRDFYADLVVGRDAAQDCNEHPEAYNVSIANFTQELDHFDPRNTQTWTQV